MDRPERRRLPATFAQGGGACDIAAKDLRRLLKTFQAVFWPGCRVCLSIPEGEDQLEAFKNSRSSHSARVSVRAAVARRGGPAPVAPADRLLALCSGISDFGICSLELCEQGEPPAKRPRTETPRHFLRLSCEGFTARLPVDSRQWCGADEVSRLLLSSEVEGDVPLDRLGPPVYCADELGAIDVTLRARAGVLLVSAEDEGEGEFDASVPMAQDADGESAAPTVPLHVLADALRAVSAPRLALGLFRWGLLVRAEADAGVDLEVAVMASCPAAQSAPAAA